METKFNNTLNIIANSALAYIIIVSVLKINGFKIKNDSRIRLSKVVKRLVINFLIYKLTLIKFSVINFWIDYYFSFYFVTIIYVISTIATVEKSNNK